ncbi:MAG: chemotaxis protein CheW [Bacteriovoracaceae bacterium]
MSTNQLSTFYVDKKLYGINVKLVQEITKAMPITPVPLAPYFIHGLINLRGQIATAVGLRELFKLNPAEENQSKINVVCKVEGLLISLVVDEVGDVLELEDTLFESTPDTVNFQVSQFMTGVYKLPHALLSVIDISKVVTYLNQ